MTPTWLDRREYPFASHWLDTGAGRLHYVDEGQEYLLPEIERRGGALRQAVERRRALLYRYEFPIEEAGRWRTSTPGPEP